MEIGSSCQEINWGCISNLEVNLIACKKDTMTYAYFRHILYDETDFVRGLHCPEKAFLRYVEDGLNEKEEPFGF